MKIALHWFILALLGALFVGAVLSYHGETCRACKERKMRWLRKLGIIESPENNELTNYEYNEKVE